MKRLSINEIKDDIKNGYGYMEYEYNYYNGHLTIIHEPSIETVTISYERDDHKLVYSIDSDRFVKMSRDQFNKYFNEQWYYNAQEIDE